MSGAFRRESLGETPFLVWAVAQGTVRKASIAVRAAVCRQRLNTDPLSSARAQFRALLKLSTRVGDGCSWSNGARDPAGGTSSGPGPRQIDPVALSDVGLHFPHPSERA